MKKIFILLLFFTATSFAQKLPFVIGAVAETGYGILNDGSEGAGLNRMTPFLGAWVQGIGFFRVGYGFYNYSRTEKSSGEHLYVRSRALNATLGITPLGPGRPYLTGSFTHARKLANVGDVTWNEWGIGGGATFQILPTAAIVTELEQRWILSHYDPVADLRVHGTRLQFNVGFVVYVY